MNEDSSSSAKWWPVEGVVPLTTHDYPGLLAAVIFLRGCAWRCEYCHNSHLWSLKATHDFSVEKFCEFLQQRKGLLDAVVISGGEASLSFQLPEIAKIIKSYGFKVGLHSSGANPHNFAAALPYLDWVGFDFKTTWDRYDKLTKSRGSSQRAQMSLHSLLESKVDYEIRSTLHPSWHPAEVVDEMGEALKALGVKKYVLQEFREEGCISDSLRQNAVSLERYIPAETLTKLKKSFPQFELRSTQSSEKRP